MENSDQLSPADIIAQSWNSQEEAPEESSEVSASEGVVENTEEMPETEPEKAPDPMASKFAALSRKERVLRQREKDLEARMKELESQTGEATSKYEDLKSKMQANPVETLAEHFGLTYEDLTKIVLNDNEPTPDLKLRESETKLMSKLEALEQKLLEKEKQEEESRHEQQISAFKNEITSFVDQNESEYEFIKANGAADEVYNVIAQQYAETGRVIEIKEAADAVEQYFEEEAKKLLALNKIKSRFEPKKPQKPEVEKVEQPTLSNEMSQTPTSYGSNSLVDREKSLAEAAKLIRWED